MYINRISPYGNNNNKQIGFKSFYANCSAKQATKSFKKAGINPDLFEYLEALTRDNKTVAKITRPEEEREYKMIEAAESPELVSAIIEDSVAKDKAVAQVLINDNIKCTHDTGIIMFNPFKFLKPVEEPNTPLIEQFRNIWKKSKN